MPSVYLDTNALIQLVEGENTALQSLLQSQPDGDNQFVTSELTLAELLVKPIQTGSARLAEIYETVLFDPVLFQTMAVDRSILRKSAQIRAVFGGKLPDAIHVATAVLSGCTVIVSSDRRLRLPASLRRVDVEDVDQLGEGL